MLKAETSCPGVTIKTQPCLIHDGLKKHPEKILFFSVIFYFQEVKNLQLIQYSTEFKLLPSNINLL